MKNIRLMLASAGLVVTLAVSTLLPASAAAKPVHGDNDNKVTICHRDDDVKKPYGPKAITVDENGLDGHGDHTGPLATSEAVAQELKDNKTMWGDIIPPTPDLPNGLNYTAQGKAMLENNCQFVTEAVPAAVVFTAPTCTVLGSYTVPTTTGVEYLVGGQVVAAGTYTAQNGASVTVTAQAVKGYFISENTTASWSGTFAAATNCTQGGQGGGQVLGASTTTQVAVTPSGGVSAGAGGAAKASTASVFGFVSSIATVGLGLTLRRKWSA